MSDDITYLKLLDILSWVSMMAFTMQARSASRSCRAAVVMMLWLLDGITEGFVANAPRTSLYPTRYDANRQRLQQNVRQAPTADDLGTDEVWYIATLVLVLEHVWTAPTPSREFDVVFGSSFN